MTDRHKNDAGQVKMIIKQAPPGKKKKIYRE
jgi:hypothetical protein